MSATMQELAKEPTANDYLKSLAQELQDNPPSDDNHGHDSLMIDLVALVADGMHFQFHDFKNEKDPAPKMALINRLQELIANTQDGKYDN